MYCGKCGTENDNSAVFCVKCGATIQGEVAKPNSGVVGIKSNSRNRKVGIISSVVIVFVVLIAVFNMFGGRSYESTVKKYFNASMEADAKAIVKLIPEEVLAQALKDEGYDEEEMELFIEEGEKQLKKYTEKIDNAIGEGWKATYHIKETEDFTGKSLKEIKEDYEDYDIEISEAKKVKIEATVKGKDEEKSNTLRINLIKVGRNWYLDVKNMGGLF